MKFKMFRNILLAAVLIAVPVFASCGDGSEDPGEYDEAELGRKLEDGFTQADLAPVEEVEVGPKDDLQPR